MLCGGVLLKMQRRADQSEALKWELMLAIQRLWNGSYFECFHSLLHQTSHHFKFFSLELFSKASSSPPLYTYDWTVHIGEAREAQTSTKALKPSGLNEARYRFDTCVQVVCFSALDRVACTASSHQREESRMLSLAIVLKHSSLASASKRWP